MSLFLCDQHRSVLPSSCFGFGSCVSLPFLVPWCVLSVLFVLVRLPSPTLLTDWVLSRLISVCFCVCLCRIRVLDSSAIFRGFVLALMSGRFCWQCLFGP